MSETEAMEWGWRCGLVGVIALAAAVNVVVVRMLVRSIYNLYEELARHE